MGCDGGTIPKRDELVRRKKKAEQKDKVSEKVFLWRHCNISRAPLNNPVVACGLGRLYNKDALILALLDKSTLPESSSHIKTLKDVKELKLTSNPTFEAEIEKGGHYSDHQTAPFICPVIGLEMSGNFKFCFSWVCGCVISERAMKQLKSNVCHKCQTPVNVEDIVILNPTDDDVVLMKTRLEARQARIKAQKKSKKIKQEIKKEKIDSDIEESSTNGCSSKSGVGPKVEKTSIKIEKLVAKRPADEGLSMKSSDFKKTKKDYSVSKDPNASNVYKSLFTTSAEKKSQYMTIIPF